jgi:hypothetical protein
LFDSWRKAVCLGIGKSATKTIQLSAQLPKKGESNETQSNRTLPGTQPRYFGGGGQSCLRTVDTRLATFKVQQGKAHQYGTNNPNDCLTEFWGEVVNRCGYPVYLAFDLPVDTDGSHSVQIQNLSFGSNANVFCSVTSFTGLGPNGADAVGLNISGPTLSQTASVNVIPGGTIQVLCTVPGIAKGKTLPNDIAMINWTP